MILPLAMFAQLAAACAPQVAVATMAAVAQTESQLDPLAIGDNTAHRSYRPQTKAEAVAVAQRLMAEGHDLDVGLMQINQRNFGWLGLTLADAFEPCPSLAAGAKVLTAFSFYNTGGPTRGFANGYIARVVSASSVMNSPRAQSNAVPHGGDIPSGSRAKPFIDPFAGPAPTPREVSFSRRE